MDSTLQRLMAIVEQKSVTESDLRDGIVHCFCVVNRAVMRNGAMEIGEDTSEGLIDKMTRLLAQEVAANLGIDLERPTVEGLGRLQAALDRKLQFSSKDPVISRKHEEMVGKLFQLAGKR